MSGPRDRRGVSRAEARDLERTGRVAAAALRVARGNRTTATARLRQQAVDALRAAIVAIEDGAGDERAQQCMDLAARRLRAASRLEEVDR